MKLHLPVRLFRYVFSCFSLAAVFSLSSGSVTAADTLVLNSESVLSIDYADVSSIFDLSGGILQLSGDTLLNLSNCGVGDGKTYTLLTGVSALRDAEGNAIVLDSSNNAISHYFDTTRPGTGFWADATLALTDDGTLQLVRHQETVKAAQTISTRQTQSLVYSYYAGISFEDINQASSSYAYGGAIYGGTITLSDNGSVTFSGNTASSSFYARGGAIYGGSSSTITLSGNGSVTFSGNTASSSSYVAYGGAIYADGNLSIRNNDSVLFEKNAEISEGTYRLRSIYAGGSGDAISLSAAEGKSIEFRDSVYIASGYTVNLNEDYTDADGVVHKQTGDILFTGKYTETHLNELLAAAGENRTATEQEILDSLTTEVNAMTYLYGGRLRVEDGAVYRGQGITAMEGSASTVLVKDAVLNHAGYHLTFSSGSTLELVGNSKIYADTVQMMSGSSLLLDISQTDGVCILESSLCLEGSMQLIPGNNRNGENIKLMFLIGGVVGWDDDSLSVSGNAPFSSDDIQWVGHFLVANYNETTFNPYAYDQVTFTQQQAAVDYCFYEGIQFNDCNTTSYGGAIYGGSSSTITLSGNGSVTFSGNTASSTYSTGGAIYGSTITLSENESVTFSGNRASSSDYNAFGGAIDGDTITLSGNGSVTFSENTASSSSANAYGGAIYGDKLIELSGNGSVEFSGNSASASDIAYGGAICGIEFGKIRLSDNESVTFSGNTAFSCDYYDEYNEACGGAIGTRELCSIELSRNERVTFSENAAFGFVDLVSHAYGGAIYGNYGSKAIVLNGNGIVEFSGNYAHNAMYAYGGAIYGGGNRAIELSGNEHVTFSENTTFYALCAAGGAIYGGSNSTITLSNNGSVTFNGNTVSGDTSSEGGAIYGGDDSAIELSGNGIVTFSENTVSSFSSIAYGGAIYTTGNLSIRNNDSVLFEKNAENSGEIYRLRSIYAGGSGDVISLSAVEGKSIEFRDSVYIASDNTVNLNADYTDAEGVIHKQTGDIIFTGKYTEQHLNELLAADGVERMVTAEEILNSRTTEVQAMTNLYGGRLRVEAGAIYKGYGITVHEGSAATVLVKDATLNHAGYDLVFHAGTTLELVGDNAASANRLQMHTGSSLIFRENAGLVLDGTLNVQGEGTLQLENGSLSAQKIDGTGGISITGGRLELQDDTDALAVDGAVSISNTTLSGNWCGEGLTVDGVSVDADAEIRLNNLTLKSVLSNEGALVLGGEVSIAREDVDCVVGGEQYTAGASGYRYVGHSFTLVEGSGQSTAAAESKWRITENGTNRDYQSYSYTNGVLTAYIERDITTYWVNDAVTYDGRNEFDTAETLVLKGGKLTLDSKLGDNLTGGIRVDAASTLSLSSGVEVQRAQLSGVSASNTVSLDGAGKLNLGSSADFTGYALAKGWSGTVKLENITTDTNLDMNTIGQSGSTIELENVMGYTGVNGGTVAADLQLNRSMAAGGTEQAALVISNGYSHKTKADHVMTTFSGTVSGEGKMVYEKTLSNEYTGFAFSGDVSGWTGAFEMNGGKTFNLVFNGKATEINADIRDISGNGTLNLRLGANAAMSVNGTVDADSIIVTNNHAVSFSNTVETGSLSAAGSSLSFDAAAEVSGDMSAAALTLGASGSLSVGGTLSTDLITMKHLTLTAPALMVGQFAAGDTIFSLSRENLDSLNLAHGESVVIARAGNDISQDFRAWVAEGSTSIDAVVYRYDLSVSGADVMVSKDYANWGTRVWYGNEWVGKESWKDYMAAGYDAVNGVETLNLGGELIEAENLIIAPGDSAAVTELSNGDMSVSYTEVADGKLRIAEGTVLETVELAAEDRDIELQGELIVTDGQIGTLSGTTGELTIDGELRVDSNVTLGSLDNAGSLDIGKHKLNVAGALTNGGNVIAGEVVAHNRTRNFAEFDTLVADRVTVTNTSTSASYTDNISVGDGSAIGELTAEKLEVRGGIVTLGRTDAATEQVLKALDLQDDAALVLNQQTSLSVTDELSATEGAELRLKQQASVSYGDMNISNHGAATQVVVNAYELANDSIRELSYAHVAVSGSGETSIDYKLTNSSVENTGSGKLVMTHAENTLSGVFAAGGDITVMNQALALNLDELVVGEGVSFSAYRGETELPEQEAVVSVSQSVSFGAGAHINADLKLQSGVRVEMNGPVSMGSDLYLFSGMTLGGAMLETLTSTEQGQTVVLFSGIDRLYLSGEEQTDAIALSHGISASEYFVNLISSQERSYYLVYDNELPGEGVLSIAVSGLAVPEPTSSTLGLLALAALAARRRRK